MSDVEWVQESDFEKVNVGDRVKILRKSPGSPDDEFIFTVRSAQTGSDFELRFSNFLSNSDRFILRDDDLIFVESPVAENGYYLDGEERPWKYSVADGWEYLLGKYLTGGDPRSSCPPFRLLRPVDDVRAETAKEVINWVERYFANQNLTKTFTHIREVFKVSS